MRTISIRKLNAVSGIEENVQVAIKFHAPLEVSRPTLTELEFQ